MIYTECLSSRRSASKPLFLVETAQSAPWSMFPVHLFYCHVQKYPTYISRSLDPPLQPQGGELVEVCDTWIDKSHPAALMASAAFTRVGGWMDCSKRE